MSKKKKHINNNKIPYFLKYTIYIFLISQLWISVSTFFEFDDFKELVEYVLVGNDVENETDTELQPQKYFEDKIFDSIVTVSFKYRNRLTNHFIYSNSLFPVNHTEIQTPPPEFIS